MFRITQRTVVGSVVLAVSALICAVRGATHDFLADLVFKGSSLAAWKPLGTADWTASNGEITGTSKSHDGGWLMLDKKYQDVEFYTEFRCTGPCNAGILLRVEKIPDGGLKGIY